MMGICPQHDILWDQLTGMEHVVLFAGLRGVPATEIHNEAEKRLKEVELWNVRDVQSSAYSGGMRRRLSMAIALIGDPKVVFLDEPTTGMDPVRGVYVVHVNLSNLFTNNTFSFFFLLLLLYR
jgi:ABC-type multidrug transport system ATPase subunit